MQRTGLLDYAFTSLAQGDCNLTSAQGWVAAGVRNGLRVRERVSNRGGTVLWSQEAEGHQYSIYQVVTARSEAQRTPIPFYGAGPLW